MVWRAMDSSITLGYSGRKRGEDTGDRSYVRERCGT